MERNIAAPARRRSRVHRQQRHVSFTPSAGGESESSTRGHAGSETRLAGTGDDGAVDDHDDPLGEANAATSVASRLGPSRGEPAPPARCRHAGSMVSTGGSDLPIAGQPPARVPILAGRVDRPKLPWWRKCRGMAYP